MANALYDKGRQKFLEGDIAWLTDDIKCCLLKIGTGAGEYDVDLANHEFLDDLDGIQETSANFDGKTSTAGVADANNVTFTSATGDECGAVVIYKDTGTTGTSPLIAYIDDATGLPVTPTGADVTIEWDDTPDVKIFKL